VEGQINDSFAMRRFMGLGFGTEQVPDTTTLLHFRHLFEKHKLGEAMFASLNARLEADGPVDGQLTASAASPSSWPSRARRRRSGRGRWQGDPARQHCGLNPRTADVGMVADRLRDLIWGSWLGSHLRLVCSCE